MTHKLKLNIILMIVFSSFGCVGDLKNSEFDQRAYKEELSKILEKDDLSIEDLRKLSLKYVPRPYSECK